MTALPTAFIPPPIPTAPPGSGPLTCPGCNSALDIPADGPLRCPRCNWTGEVYTFDPKPLEYRSAETALPEDATCVHHPRKKATAVCAGTGDYICALCTIELDGQTYGAEYLNRAGRDKASKAFDRVLPRPDSRITLYFILHIVPYINAAVVALAFLWVPHAYVLYFRALRLRRENPVFARVMGPTSVAVLPVLLVIYTVAWLTGAAYVTYLIFHHR